MPGVPAATSRTRDGGAASRTGRASRAQGPDRQQGEIAVRVAAAFGTLLAKLIVTGASRTEALKRARRAMGEFEVAGVATSLPFHRWAVTHEAFAPPDPRRSFSVHAGWVESAYPSARRDK